MRRIEIERDIAAHTPVTDDILGMMKRLSAWTPKTLEQVIEVGNRLIHAASEDIFYSTSKERKAEKVPYFMDMKGKMIKYPNGVLHSTEYIYVTGVEIDDKEWETTANITGVRLSKYNRIGNDTVQLYTLPIRFSSIVDMKEDAVTVLVSNYRVEYAIVSNFAEYKDVVGRMKAFAPLVQSIPEVMTRDMVKISLHKKSFTNDKAKVDNKVESRKQFNSTGKKCQKPPTSTTTSKETSKSCAEPSDTTSSSPETMGNGTAGCTPRPRVSGTSRKSVSRKSPRSSKSS